MKRLVRWKLNFKSKWLTLSGVMMGIAFFLQAVEFFALGQFLNVDMWNLFLFLIMPMTFEALWCAPVRTERWSRAEPHGVFAALICLVLLGQVVLSGGVFQIVMASIFFVLAAATAVLITWGFIPHRALGMLVFAGVAVMQVLVFVLPRYAAEAGYLTLIQVIPQVCVTLSVMCFFGGIHMAEDENL